MRRQQGAIEDWLAVNGDVEVAQHPLALAAAAAERPAPADQVATFNTLPRRARLFPRRWRLTAAKDLVDAVLRQAQRDLPDRIVAEVPTDRAIGFGHQLGGAQERQDVELQSPERARDDHAIESRRTQLIDQRQRDAALVLDLVLEAAGDRLQRDSSLEERMHDERSVPRPTMHGVSTLAPELIDLARQVSTATVSS